MDISKFDVILRMDWLTAHRAIIDCDRRRVTAYTLDGICAMFQEDKHDALPRCGPYLIHLPTRLTIIRKSELIFEL